MKEYEFKVNLIVRVEAFDPSDAADLIEDTFGVGDDLGVEVLECETALIGEK